MTKSKRDITLGEMQDECKREYGEDFSVCEICDYKKICFQMEQCPKSWDLKDAPRFTDDQKAFLRGWYAIGAREAHKCTIEGEGDPFDVIDFYDSDGCCIGTVSRLDWIKEQIEFGVEMELYDVMQEDTCAK